MDYFNIHNALSRVIRNAKEDPSKPRAVRVLLRPGRYDLRKAITMDEDSTSYDKNNNINRSVSVIIETMPDLPRNYSNGDPVHHSMPLHLPSDQSKRKLKTSIKNIFRCRTVDVESEDEESFADHDSLNEYHHNPSLPSEEVNENAIIGDGEGSLVETQSGTHENIHARQNRNCGVSVNRATLVLTTRRHNEPLLRVLQGSVTIRNIDLRHVSLGNGKIVGMKKSMRSRIVKLQFSI